jgi:hypothetical protein
MDDLEDRRRSLVASTLGKGEAPASPGQAEWAALATVIARYMERGGALYFLLVCEFTGSSHRIASVRPFRVRPLSCPRCRGRGKYIQKYFQKNAKQGLTLADTMLRYA